MARRRPTSCHATSAITMIISVGGKVCRMPSIVSRTQSTGWRMARKKLRAPEIQLKKSRTHSLKGSCSVSKG